MPSACGSCVRLRLVCMCGFCDSLLSKFPSWSHWFTVCDLCVTNAQNKPTRTEHFLAKRLKTAVGASNHRHDVADDTEHVDTAHRRTGTRFVLASSAQPCRIVKIRLRAACFCVAFCRISSIGMAVANEQNSNESNGSNGNNNGRLVAGGSPAVSPMSGGLVDVGIRAPAANVLDWILRTQRVRCAHPSVRADQCCCSTRIVRSWSREYRNAARLRPFGGELPVLFSDSRWPRKPRCKFVSGLRKNKFHCSNCFGTIETETTIFRC